MKHMTEEELMAEIDALDAAYAAAAEHDAKVQGALPEEWEDPTDYVGMGWIDSRGRP